MNKSLEHLANGYMDYAKEVVLDRAIPDIDGFKPSQRRILYGMKYLEDSDLTKDLTKCGGISGVVMKIHPHGDSSIYDTMVRMTDCAMYLNTPFIQGKGSFGHVFSTDEKAAASRYTECMFTKIAGECFKGMNGVTMLPTYDNKRMEPALLPVSFPNILCNTAQGIAVGIASNIPSFNFHEVNKATIEYIEKGKISKLLAPDFTTGGYYIMNEAELERLMDTGSAKIKLRGKWHIEGKIIVVDEIPYYTTVEEIKNAVKDIQGVTDVKDECDRSGFRLTIECMTKKLVDPVLAEVLRISNLQMQITANIVLIIDNVPRVVGVREVISEWVKFREKVLEKEYSIELERLKKLIEKYDILVDLMTTDKREVFLEMLLKDTGDVKELLRGYYPEAEESIFDWILDIRLKSLKGVGNKQISYLESLREDYANIQSKYNDISGCIVKELKELNRTYKLKRKTEITTVDYTFDKKKKKIEAVPVMVSLDGLFIRKMKNSSFNTTDNIIKCKSDDIVSYLDTTGRLMRVQLDTIPYCTISEKGTYLPRYFEVEDFKVADAVLVEDITKGYIYSDGYISVIDYNEWASAKRKIKITDDGLRNMETYLGVVELKEDYLLLRSKRGKIAVVGSDFIRKRRTARTKLIRVGKGDEIISAENVTLDYAQSLLGDIEYYKGFRLFNKSLLEAN